MYVRVKKRKLATKNVTVLNGRNDYSLRFVIVENRRVDGTPRQRIVKYLGSTRLSKFKSHEDKKNFHDQIKGKLEALEDLVGYRGMIKLQLSLIRAIYGSKANV